MPKIRTPWTEQALGGIGVEPVNPDLSALNQIAEPEVNLDEIYGPGADTGAREALLKKFKPGIGSRLRDVGLGFADAASRAYGGAGGWLDRAEAHREAKKQEALGNLAQKRRDMVQRYLMKKRQEHATGEREAGQEFRAGEAEKEREFRSGEAEEAREFKASEAEKERSAAMDQVLAKMQAAKGEKSPKFVQEIRKEVQKLKSFQSAQTARKGLKNAAEFAKDPSGFKDYGTLMAALKALQGDESVIREAEMRQGINATSMLNKARNQLQRAIEGKTLQPQQRKEIIDALAIMSKHAINLYAEESAPARAQAEAMGLPMEQIFATMEMPKIPGVTDKKADEGEGEKKAEPGAIRKRTNKRTGEVQAWINGEWKTIVPAKKEAPGRGAYRAGGRY